MPPPIRQGLHILIPVTPHFPVLSSCIPHQNPTLPSTQYDGHATYFMKTRDASHHFRSTAVDADVPPHGIQYVNALHTLQLPRPCCKHLWLRRQRTHGAHIDHVARQLAHHQVFHLHRPITPRSSTLAISFANLTHLQSAPIPYTLSVIDPPIHVVVLRFTYQ
jgi:hypothetical protein